MTQSDRRAPAWSRTGVRVAVLSAAGVVLLAVAVLVAQWMREQPAIRDFIATYPGDTELPAGTPIGFPAWLAWQHFLNAFLLLFIVRTGWAIRSKRRPPFFRTRDNTGLLRTPRPPRRLSGHTWFHLVLDTIWIANGVVYVVLMLL